MHEFREASRNAWISQAITHGLLSEKKKRGDWLRPHRSQTINGDGTASITTPASEWKEATELSMERRSSLSPCARKQHDTTASSSTPTAPAADPRKRIPSGTDRAPGVIAASFDTAWRGKHRAPLIRRGLIVFTRQHNGINPHPLTKYQCKCKMMALLSPNRDPVPQWAAYRADPRIRDGRRPRHRPQDEAQTIQPHRAPPANPTGHAPR
ncbi:hypothetical protein [Streptomyces sp. NPDC000878]